MQKEYVILGTAIHSTTFENVSQVIVTVAFQRRMEYHVTNTILQTFVMVAIGYMSMYFDVRRSSDRIMVALTTMLVTATLMSNIQAVSLFLHNSCPTLY